MFIDDFEPCLIDYIPSSKRIKETLVLLRLVIVFHVSMDLDEGGMGHGIKRLIEGVPSPLKTSDGTVRPIDQTAV